MFVFLAKMADTYSLPFSFRGIMTAVRDQWTSKDIRNYGAFQDSRIQVIPSNNNKLSEARLWQISQPGFLRFTP